MSTHKNIDRICCAALAVAVLLTLVLLAAADRVLPTGAAPVTLGYEDRLFDTGRVHSIDIVIDDWDGFLATAESEEYTACAVVVDGEACRNVGLRAKGNTSLTQVAAYGNDRYSFKVEFDHYEAGKSYHGLDKLSLNNLIQDGTCMKDYLAYRLMGDFGVAAPLCSYAWVTVNGADWGLYLAVEGVEDSFLARNYGGAGTLYKPDTADAGGGRGNGRAFDAAQFGQAAAGQDAAPQLPDGTVPEGMAPQLPDGAMPDGMPQRPDEADGTAPDGATQLPDGTAPQLPDGMPQPSDGAAPQLPDGTAPSFPGGQRPGGGRDGLGGPGGGRGGFGGFGGLSSADLKLQYIDDDPASYPNIFDNAKTAVTAADEARLVAALRQLSGQDPTQALDTDAVARYMAVHNFLCNGDSYTGTMVHNYYLYERDGRLAMVPWDYNLAFGGFGGGSAQSTVNTAIDDVLTDRPMQSWLFADDASTALYHSLYAAFLQQFFGDGAAFDALVQQTAALIGPYIQKDPTAFTTYTDFTAAVAALRQFAALRARSVAGQLDGSIPATTAAQQQDPAALVGTGTLDLAAMGGMSDRPVTPSRKRPV